MDFGNFVVNPVTLALLILGLVEFVKKFGLTGNKLTIVSALIGVVIAVVYKLSELYAPAQQWTELIFFGIAAGLCASGIYSFVNARFPVQEKVMLKYTTVRKTNNPLDKGGQVQ